mmetsp:Transcript_33818/g.71115  ORF Transcript_33818/g.71115 Transcript_33818/m.71115 type:complete len:544 (-) Transcript_33818:131-1762(-)
MNNVGILSSSPAANSVLQDARLLNSDIGRHSVQCNFSTRLAGRFYQNGSLERHTLRKSRLVEMQARKRRLEKELELEERRVRLLEERLGETEKAREDAQELIITIERGVVRLQSFVRRKQALQLFSTMRYESRMKNAIAKFFQCRYRGWKGRLRAESRKEYLSHKQRDVYATMIQARVRRFSQRSLYLDLLLKEKLSKNQSAAVIQALLRGKLTRQAYLDEIGRRQGAAESVQQIWRGAAVRIMVEKMREEALRKRMEAGKPKRIPLHLRRYSTYGSNNNRKGGAPNSLTKSKRDLRMRRRSSDAMIIMKDGRLSSLAHLKSSSTSMRDPDENDSIGTTITSLTNQSNTTENTHQKGRSSRYRSRVNKNNHPPWHTPQRIPAPPSNNNVCKNKGNNNNPRRASLERRSTVSGGSIKKWARERSAIRTPSSRQPSLTKCEDSDSEDSSPPREKQKSGSGDVSTHPSSPKRKKTNPVVPASTRDTIESAQTTSLTRREDLIKTPITVSKEASLIVQDVLGKIVMCQSIVHSRFDDEFSEHEDDLD